MATRSVPPHPSAVPCLVCKAPVGRSCFDANAKGAEARPKNCRRPHAERVAASAALVQQLPREVRLAPELRVHRDGSIRIRTSRSATWRPATRAELARDYAVDHPLWDRLRSRGILRPSPPGPRPANADRERKLFALRLSKEEGARLDALARERGLTRSAFVVSLVDAEQE